MQYFSEPTENRYFVGVVANDPSKPGSYSFVDRYVIRDEETSEISFEEYSSFDQFIAKNYPKDDYSGQKIISFVEVSYVDDSDLIDTILGSVVSID